MTDLIVNQSKAKISVWTVMVFLSSAFISSAVSYSGIGLLSVALFADKFAHFAAVQAPVYVLFLILILFYDRQFISISASGFYVGRRLGSVRQISFDKVIELKSRKFTLVVILRDEASVKIDTWRYKKAALEQVQMLLREYCRQAHT